MNRRRFTMLGLGGIASTALVACGNEVGNEESVNPTKIADVPGAPNPTLAAMATPGGEAPEGGEATPVSEGGGAIQVSASELKFEPKEISASPGDVITVTNDGVIPHDFAIDELGGVLVDLLASGASGDWTVPDEPGTYTFYCTVPGHRQSGMEGTLTIAEAGAAPAGEGEETSPPADEDAGGDDAPAAGGGPIAVSASELKFEPKEISASPGDIITVTNDGVIPHDFAIDDFDGVLVDMLNSGESGDWSIPADAPAGTYTFYCTVPGHRGAGMEGTLTIG